MSSPSKDWQKNLYSGNLWHNGDPVSKWSADIIEVTTDPSGNIKPCKPNPSSEQKVDGLIAGIIARDCTLRQPKPVVNPYESQGAGVVYI